MKSYQRIQCIGHTDFKGLSNAVTNTHPLLPSMGTTRQKSSCRNRLQNGPHSLLRMKVGTLLAFANRIAHKGLHTETRGVLGEGGIITLGAFRTFTNIPGPGVRTAYFAPFGSRSRVLPKNAKRLRDSDALMRVAVPRRRGPAGLRDLFRFCRNCGLYALRSGSFRVCETWEVSLPSACFACCRNAGRPLVKKAHLPFSEVG